jgi:hypothetical protein
VIANTKTDEERLERRDLVLVTAPGLVPGHRKRR